MLNFVYIVFIMLGKSSWQTSPHYLSYYSENIYAQFCSTCHWPLTKKIVCNLSVASIVLFHIVDIVMFAQPLHRLYLTIRRLFYAKKKILNYSYSFTAYQAALEDHSTIRLNFKEHVVGLLWWGGGQG